MKKFLAIVGVHIGILLTVGCTTTPKYQAPEPQQAQTITPEVNDEVPYFDVRTFGSLQAAFTTASRMFEDPNNNVPEDEILFQLTDACVGYISQERPLLTASAMSESDMTTAEYDKQKWIATRVRELYLVRLALMVEFVTYGGSEAEKDFDNSLELYGETMSVCVNLAMADSNFTNLLKDVQKEYMKDKQEI